MDGYIEWALDETHRVGQRGGSRTLAREPRSRCCRYPIFFSWCRVDTMTSRDQTVRIFDIPSIKECVFLRGHRKEVRCAPYLPILSPKTLLIVHASPSIGFGMASLCTFQPAPKAPLFTGTNPLQQWARLLQISQQPHHRPPLAVPCHHHTPRPRRFQHRPRKSLPRARLERLGLDLPPARLPTRLSRMTTRPASGARASRRRRRRHAHCGRPGRRSGRRSE